MNFQSSKSRYFQSSSSSQQRKSCLESRQIVCPEKKKCPIQQIKESITRRNNKKAFNLIKELLLLPDYAEINSRYFYYGLGNRENINGYKTIDDFLDHLLKKSTLCKNLFDLMGIIFMIQILQKRLSCEETIKFYQTLEGNRPQKAQILMGMGNTYYNCHQFLKAQEYYLKAQNIQPKPCLVYEYLAWIKCQVFGMYKQALKYCHLSLNIFDRNYKAMYIRAVCLSDRKQSQRQLNRLAKKYPHFLKVFYMQTFHHYGDSSKIVRLCNYVLSHNSRFLKAYFMKARHLDEIQQQKMYEKAIEIYSGCFQLWHELGERQKDIGNYELAIQHFEKCLKMNPYHFSSLKYLAQIYEYLSFSSKEFLIKSMEYYKQFIELNIYDEQVFNALGRISYKIGDFEQSKRYFQLSEELLKIKTSLNEQQQMI